ncbi:MAG: proprotein convertase P-domain-containing protein [Thermoanaerobaculia bacterium]
MRAIPKNLSLSLLALAFGLLAYPLGAQVVTYTCGTAPGADCRSQIPDATGDGVTVTPGVLASTITVPPGTCGGLLADIDLAYSFRHDWVGDLAFEVVAPGGTGAPAGDFDGSGSGDDFDLTQPVFRTSFPTLTGLDPHGVWSLRAIDRRSSNVGALEDWTLSIVCQTAAPAIPFVSVTTNPAGASEVPSSSGVFVFTRRVVDDQPLVVHFTLGGTAGAADYAPLASTVTIPAGAASVVLTVVPIADGVAEPDETVVLTLVDVPEYDPGSPASATVTITDATGPAVVPAAGAFALLLLGLTIAAGGFALLRSRLA